mgnify:CR=1 FL=1
MIKLNKKVDLFASLYQDTDFLLPHDDKLESRKIAFIIYLSNLEKKDGGEVLELDLDGHLLILDDLAPITQKLKTIFLTLIFLVMLVLMLQIKLVKKKFILEIVLRYLNPMKAFINMLTR